MVTLCVCCLHCPRAWLAYSVCRSKGLWMVNAKRPNAVGRRCPFSPNSGTRERYKDAETRRACVATSLPLGNRVRFYQCESCSAQSSVTGSLVLLADHGSPEQKIFNRILPTLGTYIRAPFLRIAILLLSFSCDDLRSPRYCLRSQLPLLRAICRSIVHRSRTKRHERQLKQS